MTSRGTVLIALMAACLPGRSATLSAPNQAAGPGQVVTAAFRFSAEGQTISGVQFDLEWDRALDIKLVMGEQLRQSSKVLYTSSPGQRILRCLIVGPNADTLPEGELLKAFVIVGPQSSPGTAQVRLKNTFATDPAGNSMPFGPGAMNVEIQNRSSVLLALPPEGMLNAASLLPGRISPGEIITLLGNIPGVDVSVLFNGVRAPVLYAGANQVNAIVPFGLDLNRPANVDVRVGNQSVQIPVPVAPSTPALFTQNGGGSGPGAILNADYSVNSASNPAPRASTVMLYGTGFGALEPQPADGTIVSATAPTSLRVAATIAGAPAAVAYAGAAPGLVAGVIQINVQIPADISPNLAAGVLLRIGSAATPDGVTLAIR
jgi:uncharacterized protein (TIGR03437 family)